jgi:hypothetical protein
MFKAGEMHGTGRAVRILSGWSSLQLGGPHDVVWELMFGFLILIVKSLRLGWTIVLGLLRSLGEPD